MLNKNNRRRYSQLVLENVSLRLARAVAPAKPEFPASFEVQMGIIAACAPTLRPGWKWLRETTTKGHSSHKGHALLTDEVHLRPYGGGAPTSVAMVSSKHGTDPQFSESLQPPLPLIQKTTRVDVEVGDQAQALHEL